ncbi:MAG: hypothetical protein HC933_08995 [Pleurocapsa sp. SU_196_0]|nr:hypothetical protein [Pleurocapsa sp. SU_196_0]
MNPMDLWSSITVDPTVVVREFRQWLHDVSFEGWMRSLAGVLVLVALAMHGKALMVGKDPRAYVGIMLRVALVAAVVVGQQDLRIKAETWYGDLYRWGQGVIQVRTVEASNQVTVLSGTLAALTIGVAGYKVGTVVSAARGATTAESIAVASKGAVQLLLGAGYAIFGLLMPVYMAYYVSMMLCGLTITFTMALLPVLAAFSMFPGPNSTGLLMNAARTFMTCFFVMLILPHVFNLALSLSWIEPSKAVDVGLQGAWVELMGVWTTYNANLGIPGLNEAATLVNVITNPTAMGQLAFAIGTAIMALIGGILMIVVGMIASVTMIRRIEGAIAQLFGGLSLGGADAIGGTLGAGRDFARLESSAGRSINASSHSHGGSSGGDGGSSGGGSSGGARGAYRTRAAGASQAP